MILIETPITKTIKVTLPYEPGYTLHEVSHITGMNHTYLYRLVKEGKLKAYEAQDGTLKVSKDDLAEFIANRMESI